MISKISKCRIVDSFEVSELHEGDQASRVELSNYRILPESSSDPPRKRHLKALLVLSLFDQFLKFVEAQQTKIQNEASVDLQVENADISDPFLKKYMQKRYRSDKKISGYFYTAIAPVALPVRKMREVAVTAKTIRRMVKNWLHNETKPPMSTRKRGLYRTSLKKLTNCWKKSTPRLSLDLQLLNLQDTILQPNNSPTPSPPPIHTPNKPSPIGHPSISILPQKLLESQLFQFQHLARDVNQITHRNMVYEFVAVKYLLGSALANSAVLKTDLLELQNYEGVIQKKEKGFLLDMAKRVEQAVQAINTIIVEHLRRRSRRVKRKDHSMSKVNISDITEKFLQQTDTSRTSALHMITNSFANLHKQLSLNCQKFFSHQCNRLTITGQAYRNLLKLSSKARYGMMYLHRQIVFLIDRLNECPQTSINPVHYDSYTRHVAQMTRILNEKYNMSTRKTRQECAFYSESTSPRRGTSLETKKLIKMFRSGEFRN